MLNGVEDPITRLRTQQSQQMRIRITLIMLILIERGSDQADEESNISLKHFVTITQSEQGLFIVFRVKNEN